MENNTSFSVSQTDGFNEVMEIGLNSSAEILSKLLNNGVELSTQQLNQEKIRGLESFGDEPGLAVGLNISGAIEGSAAVVVQSAFVREILNVLMSVDESSEGGSQELDEIAIGTFKELIGQTAAAFADSITNFLGSAVKIEAGEAEEISEECDEVADFLGCSVEDEAYSLVSSFKITDVLSGNFIIALNEDAVVNTIGRIMDSDDEDDNDGDYDDDGFESSDSFDVPPIAGAAIAAARRAGQPTSVVRDGGINVQSASFPSFAGAANGSGVPLLNGNIDLLMDVPLNVTIEIGKTRKKMRDIMEFAQGTIIDLEKQAGAPVDVVVNGQLIARGDVVVIDDNFGVRITEIVGSANLIENK
ncbi:MAG: flagellar motor switch protein FliN [Porcipelethomonas sp.]